MADTKDTTAPEAAKPKKKIPEEKRNSADASLRIDGQQVDYTATAGTLHLRDADGEPRAQIFYVEYLRHVSDDERATRPVTFCFNGGPGSSAVWLQFGAFGPKRADIPDAVMAPPAPWQLVDNEHSLLDVTDLVFIDPVETGFSTAVGETDAKDFLDVKGDVASITEFVWRWVSAQGRWSSPKLLAGESYGTTRGAAIAHALHDTGIALNAMLLVSPALNFQTIAFEAGNDLPYVLFLPGFAATAAYHGKVTHKGSLSDWLEEIEAFAIEQYAPALLQGSGLAKKTRKKLAKQLASYTGLDAAEIEERNLRIDDDWFFETLLKPERVGRLDSRFRGRQGRNPEAYSEMDPSYSAVLGPFTALANDYLRRELGFETRAPYKVLNAEASEKWNFKQDTRMGYVNTTEELRRALVINPQLKVLIAAGHYDLATPYTTAAYTKRHIDPSQDRDNVVVRIYEAGHMMYLHPPSLRELRGDILELIASAGAVGQ